MWDFFEIEYEEEPPLENWFELFEETQALIDDIVVAENEESREQLYDTSCNTGWC